MTQKRTIRKYTDEFREEAVALVTQQGYSVTEAVKSLGITTKLIYNWKDKLAVKNSEDTLSPVDLTMRAFQMVVNLRQPKAGLMFHNDRGSQYTSKRYQALLIGNQTISSMSGRGACLDNAVVERFFGSLKNEWLLHVYHLTRNSMQIDVEKYIKYYNSERLHTTLNDMSPIEFENVREKCAA